MKTANATNEAPAVGVITDDDHQSLLQHTTGAPYRPSCEDAVDRDVPTLHAARDSDGEAQDADDIPARLLSRLLLQPPSLPQALRDGAPTRPLIEVMASTEAPAEPSDPA